MFVPLDLQRPWGLTPPSAISRVPPELLSKIFLYVVSHQEPNASVLHPIQETLKLIGTTRTAPHTPSYVSCAGPFSISHVCSTWRGVSLSIPALWTNLRVISPRTPKLLCLLSSWIGRTRQRPLSLSLYQHPCSPRTDHATRSVWRLFLSVMDKWRYLEVNVSMGFDKLVNYGLCKTGWAAPLNLETIKISFDFAQETPLPRRRNHRRHPKRRLLEEWCFFACLLHCSPRLRSAQWDNRHLAFQFDLISQFWGTLTDLTLAVSQDVVELVSALSRCSALQKLTIYNQTHGTSVDTNIFSSHPSNSHSLLLNSQRSSRYVDLPNLHTLTLGTFTQPETLFRHLLVPGIRTLLVLHGRYNRRGWRGLSNAAWASLQEMCRRCGARLSFLAVGGVEVDAAFDEPQWKGLARCGSANVKVTYSPLQKV